jgi:putative NIF3 family GTP cyclohydrolase 1 type 2
MEFSRRRFARLAGAAALAAPGMQGQQTPLTAQQAIDRIQKNIGMPWRAESLDTIKAGDPAAILTGIAATAMATAEVLARAVKEKANLILTLEPAFFGGKDAPLAGDPVFAAKQDFIQKKGLVIWRFSDHWRARRPDPFLTGLARALGWTDHGVIYDASRFEPPEMSLSALADHLAKRLDARAGIRVVGDPQTRVSSISIIPGASPLSATMQALPQSDVVIAGETREWESVEYAQDTVASGQKKGFIMLGRLLSEEPGMNVCADWLKTLVPEVPVQWLPAGDPYWRPA